MRSCCRLCRDFSSRARQLPELSSIEVAAEIFHKSICNTARRAREYQRGMLSPQEVDAADEKLANWLGTTFSGRNRHYRAGEEWNPGGLAEYLRSLIGSRIRETVGTVPEDDAEVIFAAAALFLKDVYRLIDAAASQGGLEGIENSPAAARLVNLWSRLATGAPVEVILGYPS